MIFLDENDAEGWELDDERARSTLESLLRKRRRANEAASKREGPSKRDAIEATLDAAELVRGVLGWAVDILRVRIPLEEYRNLPPAAQRRLLVETLRLGLPVMQPGAAGPLAQPPLRA